MPTSIPLLLAVTALDASAQAAFTRADTLRGTSSPASTCRSGLPPSESWKSIRISVPASEFRVNENFYVRAMRVNR